MNKFMETEKKIEKAVVSGYKAIENIVVNGYEKIEDSFSSSYKIIDRKFVEVFLMPDDASNLDAWQSMIY